MQTAFRFLLTTAFVAAAVNASTAGAPAPKLDFNRDIRPILSAKCYACHGPDPEARKAKLRLDLRDEAVKARDGKFAIKPGNAAQSELVKRITTTDLDDVMPPKKGGHPLTTEERALLQRWVEQGAPYSEHWAFTKPQRPAVPKVQSSKFKVQNPIDNFIFARLEKEGLAAASPAGPHTLIRRMSLDLTGLPPTPQEVEAFVKEYSAGDRQQAVGALADRLLASSAYGERWARMWLDLARYADSAGYGSDPLRLNIWPYRDWVIAAFNRNLRYDQFTLEQLAGDLLPNASEEQLTATAFHRNTMTNTEGGTDDEEFRTAAVKDRIAVTAQVWMGLTMNCAQCHSHKFDPISNKEYYQFYALFNQTEDSDKADESPTMPLATAAEREQMAKLKEQIATLGNALAADSSELAIEQAAWETTAAKAHAWTTLEPVQFSAASGAKLTKLDDGSLLASGAVADKESYQVRVRVPTKGLGAVRLEFLTDENLPPGGPGRAAGNITLAEFRVAAGAAGEARKARFVRVELPGKGKMLSLAEVQVFSGGQNVALKGKATQSSTDYDGPPNLAMDGNTSGDFLKKSVTHTRAEDNPWWEVDLGSEVAIEDVVIWNRTDGGVGTRLAGFKVLALDAARKEVGSVTPAQVPMPSEHVNLGGGRALKLENATATAGDVMQAIDAAKKGGWVVDGAGAKAAAVFEIAGAAPDAGSELTFTLAFAGKNPAAHIRLSTTADKKPVRLLPVNISAALAVASAQRTEAQRKELAAYFRPLAPSVMKLHTQIATAQKELEGIKPVALPVMREFAKDKQRTTKMLVKGNFLQTGDTVEPAFPAAFNPPPTNAPLNRLGVAQWLMSRDNPLTARVTVNRFWSQIFGTGLVETEEDFGSQGALPSHPELLDWLAMEFADGGWDVKALLKTLVLSATYQQSSVATTEALQKDPRNRLLSRYPRGRLDAETLRDQALALSGLLSRKLGGPSVYPPQPDGLWRAAFNGQRNWATSQGEDRYRRGLYTFWRRTVPYPSMATFDAPSRENCTVRRLPTNTPLQAFVTLNDPAFVEMAQALGRRLVQEGGANATERAHYGLKLALARSPSAEQVKALVSLYEAELLNYRANTDAAKKLATEPLGELPKDLDAAEAAAWTVVANVLLNLDGVLTKG